MAETKQPKEYRFEVGDAYLLGRIKHGDLTGTPIIIYNGMPHPEIFLITAGLNEVPTGLMPHYFSKTRKLIKLADTIFRVKDVNPDSLTLEELADTPENK